MISADDSSPCSRRPLRRSGLFTLLVVVVGVVTMIAGVRIRDHLFLHRLTGDTLRPGERLRFITEGGRGVVYLISPAGQWTAAGELTGRTKFAYGLLGVPTGIVLFIAVMAPAYLLWPRGDSSPNEAANAPGRQVN